MYQHCHLDFSEMAHIKFEEVNFYLSHIIIRKSVLVLNVTKMESFLPTATSFKFKSIYFSSIVKPVLTTYLNHSQMMLYEES